MRVKLIYVRKLVFYHTNFSKSKLLQLHGERERYNNEERGTKKKGEKTTFAVTRRQ